MVQVYGTFEFGADEFDDMKCYMFGVSQGVMYKYTFVINLETRTVNLTDSLQVEYNAFDGKVYSSLVSINYYIVSCADCAIPQVSIFDFAFNLVKSYDYGAPSNDTINLAAYEQDSRMMQLFVATRSRIDSIIMQEDTNSEAFFKQNKGLFQIDSNSISGQDHFIAIGKGRNYLTFKLSSRPYLYLMATCQYDEFFNPTEFICEKCRPSHHSFGMQNENCYPCNSLWMSSSGSDVDRAIYLQKCTTGQSKSIGVIVGASVIALLVGVTCCITNRNRDKALKLTQKEMK